MNTKIIPALTACALFALAAWPQNLRASEEPVLLPQNHTEWFPFVIPTLANARTRNTAIDLSFLNREVAGAHGFLRARGESIVDGRGREVRLFGTNITDYHVMPPKDTAPLIARRLSELGVNFIRLHYYDWAKAPEGLMNDDMQTLNPQKLDQMDWLIYQLKQHGIYVDINLHVARHYPGLPDDWNEMGKGIDRIHPQFITSQKQFARDLLTHTNPYTKTSYTNEPAVAAIELNNENTALGTHTKYAELSAQIQAPIRALWNAWLQEKYGTTQKLHQAWDSDLPAPGPQLLRNSDFGAGSDEWDLETGGGSQATLQVLAGENGGKYLRWNATKAGAQEWNLQLHQNQVPVRHDQPLRLTFRARADQPRTLRVRLMQSQEPWNTVWADTELKLTTQWQEFDLTNVVNNPNEIPVRLSFDALNAPGTYDLADVSLRIGAKTGVGENVSLEKAELPLVGSNANPHAARDFLRFIGERERLYTRDMMQFLRKELGVKSLLWDTQVNYGGTQGVLREVENSDAIDIHEYPSHPNGQRDARGFIWYVEQKSMLGKAFDALPGLAQWRVAGKPFIVSEFDLNPPNDYNSETIPLLSLMSAYQNWNGFSEYAWLNFQPNDTDPNRLHSPFATSGNAGQMAFLPASALLFRLGLVRPATAQTVLQLSKNALRTGDTGFGAMSQQWKKFGIAQGAAWQQKLALQVLAAGPTRLKSAPLQPAARDPIHLVSDTAQIVLDRSQSGAEFLTVNAPAVRMAFGFTGGRSFDLGDVKLTVKANAQNNYANIMLVALDAKPIAQSKKLLLTCVARVENAGQKFNAARTTIGRDWGNGPTLAEPIRLSLDLPASEWRAQALDGAGRALKSVPMPLSRLTTLPAHGTLWYLIER